MGPAETTALVVAVVAITEGLMRLVMHLVNKNSQKEEDDKMAQVLQELASIKEKVVRLDDMHYKFDVDGTPMWYVPRAWADTQAKIVEKLQTMSQNEIKILNIIERLERRLESFPPL